MREMRTCVHHAFRNPSGLWLAKKTWAGLRRRRWDETGTYTGISFSFRAIQPEAWRQKEQEIRIYVGFFSPKSLVSSLTLGSPLSVLSWSLGGKLKILFYFKKSEMNVPFLQMFFITSQLKNWKLNRENCPPCNRAILRRRPPKIDRRSSYAPILPSS